MSKQGDLEIFLMTKEEDVLFTPDLIQPRCVLKL